MKTVFPPSFMILNLISKAGGCFQLISQLFRYYPFLTRMWMLCLLMVDITGNLQSEDPHTWCDMKHNTTSNITATCTCLAFTILHPSELLHTLLCKFQCGCMVHAGVNATYMYMYICMHVHLLHPMLQPVPWP